MALSTLTAREVVHLQLHSASFPEFCVVNVENPAYGYLFHPSHPSRAAYVEALEQCRDMLVKEAVQNGEGRRFVTTLRRVRRVLAMTPQSPRRQRRLPPRPVSTSPPLLEGSHRRSHRTKSHLPRGGRSRPLVLWTTIGPWRTATTGTRR
jgi:hypothetical protein